VQIEAQITQLQNGLEALREKEVAGMVAQIREAIDYYGLTAADLGFGVRADARAASRPYC